MPERAITYIGVDIAKTNFVADLSGTSASVAQTKQGIESFIKSLPADACVVCEATGGYEASLVEALWTAQIPVVVVMPKRVRFYAKSLGLLAKTDPIDARLLSRYARACADTLRLYQPLSPVADQLRELLRARDELIEQIKVETNHAEHPSKHPLLAKHAAKRRHLFDQQLEQIQAAIKTLICRSIAAPTQRTGPTNPMHRPCIRLDDTGGNAGTGLTQKRPGLLSSGCGPLLSGLRLHIRPKTHQWRTTTRSSRPLHGRCQRCSTQPHTQTLLPTPTLQR
ncbi:hypothetical protein Ga0100231_011525 [Opitutaceae bacterium TAV4]|nr:hypothetical protein Ga0100231_011525 [Opitutaceae bacterium TAV4]